MKTIIIMALISAQQSFAATDIWKGQGSVFGTKDETQSNYELTVKNTHKGERTDSEITVQLPNGTQINLTCTNNSDSHGKSSSWSSECSHGKGGGRCFGEGLCISYLEDASGKAFATTIAMDGPSKMRLLRTELQNGKAVKFYREVLLKQ